jgi:hypothetical protein
MVTLVSYMRPMIADSDERSDRRVLGFLRIEPLPQIKRAWERLRREYISRNGPARHEGRLALLPYDYVHYRLAPVVLEAFRRLRENAMRAALTSGHDNLPE